VIAIPVATVSVSPNSAALLPGATVQLSSVARAANGAVLVGRNVTWTSGAPSIVQVSGTGLVTALGPGTALVLATIDNVTAGASITVAPPAVASITVTPANPEILPFASVQLLAVARDAGGAVLSNRPIVWSTDDESIAFVSSSGQVVGFKPGAVRITATSEGVSATTIVTVR
jgi:uncharacterized protein YjdB